MRLLIVATSALLLTGCTSWGILTMRGASPIVFTGSRAWFTGQPNYFPVTGWYSTQEKCQAALVKRLDDEMLAVDPKVTVTRVNPNTIKWGTLATGGEIYVSHQCVQR